MCIEGKSWDSYSNEVDTASDDAMVEREDIDIRGKQIQILPESQIELL